jgi:hypothetical protein
VTRYVDEPWVTTAAIVAAVVVVLAVAALIAVGASKKHKSTAAKPAATTTTTAKPTTKSTAKTTTTKKGPVTWTHKDLQGVVIVVSKGTSGSDRFVTLKNGTQVPAAVAAIDAIFFGKGCSGGKTIYETWKKQNGQSQASRNRMSAYAEYALEKGKASKCSWAT